MGDALDSLANALRPCIVVGFAVLAAVGCADGRVSAADGGHPVAAPASALDPAGSALAADRAAQTELLNGMSDALLVYAEQGSFDNVTIGSVAGTGIGPSLVFNTSSTAVVGEISIRWADKKSVLLVEKSESGRVFCASYGAGETGFGETDATSPGRCDGPIWAESRPSSSERQMLRLVLGGLRQGMREASRSSK